MEDSEHRLVLRFSVKDPQTHLIQTNKGAAWLLTFDGASPTLKLGFPDLPHISGSVDLKGRQVKKVILKRLSGWKILSGTYVPSKGNLTRDQRPSEIPWTWGPVYSENAWCPRIMAPTWETFIVGSHEGLRFRFSPVQVHPIKKLIRFALEWEMIIEFEISTTQVTAHNKPHPSASLLFLNGSSTRYTPVPEDGDLLVIAAQPFVPSLMPWVHWKNRRGIRTHLVDLGQTGTSAAQIKNFIQNFSQQHPISHVLLVGDIQHIPSHEKWGGVSDITYGELAGQDAYPEVFVGRLSVESVSELETILSRWLRYEQNPDLSNSWLDVAVGIASDEGPGDDNQMDWEHIRGLLDQLTSYTYIQKQEFFDGTHGPPDAPGNPTAQDLLNTLNSGSGFVNYAGHGWEQGIVTTGFSNSEAALLANNGRIGMFMIVGCVTGAFHTTTCLAEKLTRTGTTAAPHGAVAVFGATINQSWSPPMEAQDAVVDILTENEASQVVMRSIGGLFYTGCMRMNDAYGIYGDAMTETWILFGDPSMPYYTRTPDPLVAVHPISVGFNASSVNVNCTVEGALVCISQNHQILGRAYIQGGQANVNLDAFYSLDSLDIVVSAFNHIPYQGRIGVIPPAGPFVTVTGWQVLDDVWGNSNQKPEFGEEVYVKADVSNLGLQIADSVVVSLSLSHPHASVINGVLTLGALTSAQTISTGQTLRLQLSNIIPDGTFIPFTLHCAWQGGVSQTQGHLIAAAPVLHITHATLQQTSGNHNGISESGEHLQATVHLSNSGTADFPMAPVELSLSHLHVNPVSAITQNIVIPANNNPVSVSYTLVADAMAPADAIGTLLVKAGAGPYTDSLQGGIHLNPTFDDFETGPFWCLPYNFGSQNAWLLDTTSPFDGQYALRSAPITDDGVSEVALTFEALLPDTISFYLRVSCEDGYDFFKVYLNNQLYHQWTGEVSWQRYALAFPAGIHTVRWRYEKDYMVAAGEDAAWIDHIVLPRKSGNVFISEPESWNLNVYPNPASDQLWLRFSEAPGSLPVSIELRDAQGLLIRQITSYHPTVIFPVKELAPGLYVLKVKGADGRVLTRRFVKT
jgi:hypothetical protein